MVSLSVTYGVTLLLASAAAIGAAFAGNYMYEIGQKVEEVIPVAEEPPVAEEAPTSNQPEIQQEEPSLQSTEQTLPEVSEAVQ